MRNHSTSTSGLLALLLLLPACFSDPGTSNVLDDETESGESSETDTATSGDDDGMTSTSAGTESGDTGSTGDGDGDGDGDTGSTGDGDGDGDTGSTDTGEPEDLLLGENCHPLGDPTCADGLTCAYIGWDGQFNQWECSQKTGNNNGYYTDPCIDQSDCALGYSCRNKNSIPTPIPDCGSSYCCIAYCFQDNDCPSDTVCQDFIPNNTNLPEYIEDEGGIRHCGVPY